MSMKTLLFTAVLLTVLPINVSANAMIDLRQGGSCEFPKDLDDTYNQYEDTCTVSLDREDRQVESGLGVSITTEQFGDTLESYDLSGCPFCGDRKPCKVIDRKGKYYTFSYWRLEVDFDCLDGSCTVTRRLVCHNPF